MFCGDRSCKFGCLRKFTIKKIFFQLSQQQPEPSPLNSAQSSPSRDLSCFLFCVALCFVLILVFKIGFLCSFWACPATRSCGPGWPWTYTNLLAERFYTLAYDFHFLLHYLSFELVRFNLLFHRGLPSSGFLLRDSLFPQQCVSGG